VAGSPTMRRRQVATELRRLRKAAGLTIEDVVQALGWNDSSKLSRIENMKIGIKSTDLRKLLDLYRVEDAGKRDELTELAAQATIRGWWQSYDSDTVPSEYKNYIGLEAAASKIWSYEQELVHGLFQTEAYATAVIRKARPADKPQEIARRVGVRLSRQEILSRTSPAPPKVSLVLSEGALRRAVGGPGVMRDQLLHLADQLERPGVDVQVLPFAAGEHPGMVNSFTVLSFEEPGEQMVSVENLTGTLALEKAKDLQAYEGAWLAIKGLALPETDSNFLLRTYALA